jgi:hypothetical protein
MRHIAMMENCQYPWHLFRLSTVDAHDTTFPDRAGDPNAMRHIP